MLTKKLISTEALQELKGFPHAHVWRDAREAMHVIRHDLKLVQGNAVFVRGLAHKLFTIPPNRRELERVPAPFRLPYQMESILPHTM